MPFRQRRERRRDLRRGVAGLFDQALNGDLRGGKVIQVTGLKFRQKHLAFVIGREFFQLLAKLRHGRGNLAPKHQGLGARINRPRLDLAPATVVETGEEPRYGREKIGNPQACQHQPTGGNQGHRKKRPAGCRAEHHGNYLYDQQDHHHAADAPLGNEPGRSVRAAFEPLIAEPARGRQKQQPAKRRPEHVAPVVHAG